VDREWEKLGYQNAILKPFHENAGRGLWPVRRAALHQLLQRGAGSGARPAEGAGQLTRGGHQHGGKETTPDPPPPRRLVGLATAEVEGARSAPAPPSASRRRPARCRSCCTPAPGPAPPPPPRSARRRACPLARPPDAAPPPAAGRWQAASRRPGGPPPQGCLAEVVRRTHPRMAVDQQPGSQKRRPPTAQAPTGPGQPLAGQLLLPAHTRCASGPHTISDSGRTCSPAASYSEAAPPQRSGPAARSPRRPRTPRPGRCCGSAGLPATSAAPAWPKVIHVATVGPPPGWADVG
jgi:hypothetical protein